MSSSLDFSSLTTDDIVYEYKTLHTRHQQLKEQSEEDAQRIHELKRNLDTALAAEAYLTQELEQLSACGGGVPAQSSQNGIEQELEEIRKRYKTLLEEHENLQQEYDNQGQEVQKLKSKLKQSEKDLEGKVAQQLAHVHDECQERFGVLETENSELMQKLFEYEQAKVKQTFEVADKERNVAILEDQVSCLEQNLKCKRDELEEKIQLLESCQEQLVEANSKIAMLSSSPNENDRKGNSLFAEVDDQRQAMRQLLAAQKKSYLDMKKVFSDSKFEIHRLKRENSAMHKELETCSNIFCSADRTYQNKLNERIRQLMKQNDSLEKQLNVSQKRLRELANDKSVTWLDSMMDFCKRETGDLKSQLHALRIQKAAEEEQMRNVQQQMARWRFECLKNRCVVIDRENLLTEHNITFKSMQAMEFNIKEEEIKVAQPRIVPKRDNSTVSTEIIVLDTPIKPKIEAINVLPVDEVQLKVHETLIQSINEDIKPVEIAKPLKKGTPVKSRLGLMKIKREQQVTQDVNVSKELQEDKDTVKEPFQSSSPGKCAEIKSEDLAIALENVTNQAEDDEDSVEFLASPSKPQQKGTPIKLRPGHKIKVRPNEELFPDARPNAKGTPIKRREVQLSDSEENDQISPAKPLRKGTPIKALFSTEVPTETGCSQDIRSILNKKRNIFGDDTNKAVHFSSSQPIVHQLSACESEAKENESPMKTTKNDTKDIKPFNKVKPNIIRRIVVSSRKATK
ncbi:protein Spindly [Drosophila tropicalis]|uniref:protein Spindly n=1 Tax=Drosophila tropicalis TaxID=46794 RepID=UPI0035AB697A